MIVPLLLADAGMMSFIAPILQVGAVGGVLVWFMFWMVPRMNKQEEAIAEVGRAIDRNARANLLLVLTLGTPSAKLQAENVIKEIDRAEEARK